MNNCTLKKIKVQWKLKLHFSLLSIIKKNTAKNLISFIYNHFSNFRNVRKNTETFFHFSIQNVMYEKIFNVVKQYSKRIFCLRGANFFYLTPDEVFFSSIQQRFYIILKNVHVSGSKQIENVIIINDLTTLALRSISS